MSLDLLWFVSFFLFVHIGSFADGGGEYLINDSDAQISISQERSKDRILLTFF